MSVQSNPSASGTSLKSPSAKDPHNDVQHDNTVSATEEPKNTISSECKLTTSSTTSSASVSDDYMSDIEDLLEEKKETKSKNRADALNLSLSIRNIYTTNSSYGKSTIGTPTGAPTGCLLM